MKTQYIQLNRTFRDVRNEADTNSFSAFWEEYQDGALTWERLLSGDHRLIAILAAAQSGKSEELRQQASNAHAEGKHAFYIPLVELASQGIPGCFTPEEESLFQQWKGGEDEALFFLDSIDECRLANQTIRAALTNLAKAIHGANDRLRVIVSSRILDWRWKEDKETIESILPQLLQAAPTGEGTSESPRSDGVKGETPQALELRIVSLKPLNRKQIQIFAEKRGIEDVEAFISAIEQRTIQDLASRPMELEGLVAQWKTNKEIGTYTEIIRSLVQSKLIDSSSEGKDSLSFEKARDGARQLALALTLTKKSSVNTPDCPAEVRAKSEALDPMVVLQGWGRNEVTTLLDRALFDEVSIGTVRLHRTYQEFLTAEWLYDQLNAPGGRRAVCDLIFVQKFGSTIIPPTFNAAAGWLGNWDQQIQEKILAIEPENFISQGDPAALSTEVRQQCLTGFARKFQDHPDTGVSFDIGALNRFQADDMIDTVGSLLTDFADHEDIQDLALRLIWAQKLSPLVEHLFPYFEESSRRYHNVLALRAIHEAGTIEQKKRLVNFCLKSPNKYDESTVGELVERYYPAILSTKQLVSFLSERAAPNEKVSTGLPYHLVQTASTLSDLAVAEELIHALMVLAQEPPHHDREFAPNLSQKYSWLEPTIKHLFYNILTMPVSDTALNPTLAVEALDILARYKRAYLPHRAGSKEVSIHEGLNQRPQLKRQFLLHRLTECRAKSEDEAQIKITFINGWVGYHASEADINWLISDASHHEDALWRMIAFNLAMRLFTPDGASQFTSIRELAEGEKAFAQDYKAWTTPTTKPDKKKLDREKKEKARKAIEAKNAADWVVHFKENIVKLSLPAAGWEHRLGRIAQWYGEFNYDDSAAVSLESIALATDQATADAFRQGCLSFWKSVTPLMPYESLGNAGDTIELVGLSGLAFESQDKRWPHHLSKEDALRAARFATLKLNGFPSWFKSLFDVHADVIVPLFMKQIEAEFSLPDDKHKRFFFLNRLSHSEMDIVAPFVRPIEKLYLTHTPRNRFFRTKALSFLFRYTEIDRDALAHLAEAEFAKAKVKDDIVFWLAVWLNVDAIPAIYTFVQHLKKLDNDDGLTVFISLANFLGSRHGDGFRWANASYLTIPALNELIPLIYTYIKVEEDQVHEGAFRPNARDNAESFRSSLIGALSDIPGKESFNAILQLAKHPALESRRHRFWAIAFSKLVKEADTPTWKTSDVAQFSRSMEIIPANADTLSLVTLRCLESIKADLEDGDTSIASLVRGAKKEAEVQSYLAKSLQTEAKGRLTVHREEEVVNRKLPDLRTHHPLSSGPTGIEVKIADKWSGADLRERLFNQLVAQYLRAAESNHGVFLLTYHGRKKAWEHPDTGEKLNFDQLLEWLKNEAETFLKQSTKVETLVVVGIDLTLASGDRSFFDKALGLFKDKFWFRSGKA